MFTELTRRERNTAAADTLTKRGQRASKQSNEPEDMMLRTMKIVLVGALVFASTVIASAQNANRLERGYLAPPHDTNPINKGVGEGGGGGP